MLISLSIENAFSEPVKGIQYAERAERLADSLGFAKGQALALKYIGMGYFVQGEYFKTINFWIESLEAFRKINDLDGESNILNNIGAIYFNQGQYVKALDYYLESLKAAEKLGNKLRILTALQNVGSIYSDSEITFDKALEYYRQALPLSIEVGNDMALGTITVNIGQIYVNKEQYDSALFYFEKSLNAFRKVEGGNTPYTLNYMGKVYALRNDFSKAIQYQQESYEIAKSRNAKLEMSHSLLGLAETYKLMGDEQAALAALNEAEALATEINASYQLKDAYLSLSQVHADLRDYKNAYQYRVLLDAVKDSIYNIEVNKKLERAQFNYDLE
ncbi:MAG TPA: tetratricopeptide repeat protein, partial [Bacteroidales bacterium]|nr:tetratricopeptide repeat protein [Bacteroidales bacterium]